MTGLLLWAGFSFFSLHFNHNLFAVSYGFFYLIFLYIVSAVWAKEMADRERLQLLELATRDGLTGVYLRRYFSIVFEKAITNTEAYKPLSIVMIDVDHFKKINDQYGHETGDFVLKTIAHILQTVTRARRVESQSDCIARYGGEEFIILALDADIKDAATNVAERVRKAIERHPFQCGSNQNVSVTISLGVAQHRVGEDAKVCIRRADKALYEAKHQGRNRVCLAD